MMRSLITTSASILAFFSAPVVVAQERAPSCPFVNATYALVEQEGAPPDARLAFRPGITVTGLAGTITTAAGAEIPFEIGVGNGEVRYYATMDLGDGFMVDPNVLAFTSTMANARFDPDAEAPQFIIFPMAEGDARFQQKLRPEAEIILPPETAWRLNGCRGA